jgi:hypothetical protein
MDENYSGTWKETFCIPKCRKSLPVPGMRHFTFLHAIKVWPLERDLAQLQVPEFPGIGECKRIPSRDPKSPEDFPGMGTVKKATARTSCCNIHNATTPATEEPTTSET